MKKLLVLWVVLLVMISIVGCQHQLPRENPGIQGYVMDKDSGRILVVSSQSEDFSETGGVEEFYNAIWFSNVPEDINLGDKVKVWFDAVAESYPGQSQAKYTKVVEEEKPKGADLTPAEALYKILTSDNIETPVGIYSIDYEESIDIWTIQLKDILAENPELREYQVKDK